jgi:predicted ATPase/Tfp pilus assembly protein PilF/DNA-binding XRE family transcriptional regulator
MEQPYSFGTWLKLKRKALDLSREGLAAQIGYSAATIRKVEAEERRPSAQFVGRLADRFAIPGDERQAFLTFARGDWQAAPGAPPPESPWLQEKPRTHLPTPATSFIGREKEVAEVRAYLQDDAVRLTTLIGPPGIGKTRLSLAVARLAAEDFPDGVSFVALAPLDDPSLIESAVAGALGLVESRDRPAAEGLIDYIGSQHLLLVLDNCEHLIDAVAPLVAGLLSACPRLKVLATSRESLRVPGEWLFTVPAMDMPRGLDAPDVAQAAAYPALTLFAERARAVNTGFVLSGSNIATVTAICERLDGLPLAIELIASRLRLMTPEELLARLTNQFVLSADGMRGVPLRQKTLHNAISWSYDFLPPDEQHLFAQLAVFAGGFTLGAAESVFGQPDQARPVSDRIMALLDKSLLVRDDDAPDEMRFNMLVTIRQFALDALRRSEGETEVRHRHLAHFLALAEEAESQLRGPDQQVWSERLERELDNFRSAFSACIKHSRTESALCLLSALAWPWSVAGHYGETRRLLDAIRELPDVERYPLLLGRVLGHVGRNTWVLEKFQDSYVLLEESHELLKGLGTEGETSLAETLNWLGLLVAFSERDFDKARALFEEGLAIGQRYEDEWLIALSTFSLGIIAIPQKRDDEALSLLEKSMALFRNAGDLFFIGRVCVYLGFFYINQGDFERARFYTEEHLHIDTEIQYLDGVADGYRDMGELYYRQGKFDQAGHYFQKCLRFCREHGLSKSDATFRLGMLALRRDDYALARQYFIEFHESARYANESRSAALFLSSLAAVAAGTGHPERAARLTGAAQSIVESIGIEHSPVDRTEYDRHSNMARRHLGAKAYDDCQNEGRHLTMEEAIAFALDPLSMIDAISTGDGIGKK